MVTVSYQTQSKVEQSRAAVEQDGDERGGGGEQEAHISTHDHPQRLQDLQSHKVLSGHIQNCDRQICKKTIYEKLLGGGSVKYIDWNIWD